MYVFMYGLTDGCIDECMYDVSMYLNICIQCMCSVYVMYVQCMCNVCVMFLHCTCNVCAMYV